MRKASGKEYDSLSWYLEEEWWHWRSANVNRWVDDEKPKDEVDCMLVIRGQHYPIWNNFILFEYNIYLNNVIMLIYHLSKVIKCY